ncbi:MAG: tail fiber protein [Verrucomicrobia bacterium]|nr:tail fiber protein [Verrucomicrobiota bacterium]
MGGLLLSLVALSPLAAQTTGSTGGNPPTAVTITKPTTAIQWCICINGVTPTAGAQAVDEPYLGEIRAFTFDGTILENGSSDGRIWRRCEGQSLPVAQNASLFSLIGYTYGGSGANFNLPDLRGRVPIGRGQGAGLVNRTVGQSGGGETVTLVEANLPPHTHTISGGATGSTGSATPVNNMPPFVVLTPFIHARKAAGPNTFADSVGWVRWHAGTAQPPGILCDGSSLPVASNAELFTAIGYTYGGSGANFQVPDLRGRAVLSDGTGPGLPTRTRGQIGGADTKTLALADLPGHTHTYPGGTTGSAGGGGGSSTLAPAFAVLTMGFAPYGIFAGSLASGALGELRYFARALNINPSSAYTIWVPCDGTIYDFVNANPEFENYSFLVGDIWGGDGFSTVGVPDLRGRVAASYSPARPLASKFGSETFPALVAGNIPAHTHSLPVASSPPTVTSPTATGVTGVAATLGGNVTSDGGATISARGVVYAPTATNGNPQLGGGGVLSATATGTTGVFTVNVASLTPGTSYSYAAYATNSVGTSYSTVGTFTTLSNVATLSSLSASPATLSPPFVGTVFSYTSIVPNATNSVLVSATPTQGGASVRINGVATSSSTVSLLVGTNSINVQVTAQDTVTTQSYTISITRRPNPPTVTSPSSTAITGVSATLGGNVTSDGGGAVSARGVVYAPTATNSNPQLGGPGVLSASASGTTGVFTIGVSSLSPGTSYSYAAYATNSEGTSYSTVGTFTTLSNVATLAALSATPATLSPTFGSNVFSYTSIVPNATSSVVVSATPSQAGATVRINGVATNSSTVSLLVGSNNVVVQVTAQDTVTTQSYTIAINREAGADIPVTLAGGVLTVTAALSPAGADTVLSYVEDGGVPYLQIYDPVRSFSAGTGVTLVDAHTIRVPLATVDQIRLIGSDSVDRFTIDSSAGNLYPANGISVDGRGPGTVPGDTLAVIGSFSSVEYDVTGLGNGTIDTDIGRIVFDNLEPVDFSGSTVGVAIIRIDPNGTVVDPVTTTVSAVDGGVNTEVTFSGGLESIKYGAITGSLTILGDDAENDYFVLTGLGSAMQGDFTVDAGGGDADVIEINNATVALAGAGRKISLKADFIGLGDVGTPAPGTPGVIVASGDITLEADGDSSIVSPPLWGSGGVWGATVPACFTASSATRGNVQLRGDIRKTSGADATLTLKARASVVLPTADLAAQTGGTVVSTSGKLHTILQSDTDGTGGGLISLGVHASISTNGGGLEFASDRLALNDGVIDAGNGTIKVRTQTIGRTIAVGGADGPAQLGLPASTLDLFRAATVVVGESTSPVRVEGAVSAANFTTLAFGGNVAFTSTGSFAARVASASSYTRMTAAGSVSLDPAAGFTATAVGGYVPTAGDAFTLLDQTGPGAIVGSFAGLGEGAALSLGGVPRYASYVGGNGNDFVLGAGIAPSFLSGASTILTIGAGGSFSVVASGTPAPTLALTGGTLPSGVTFTPATGLLEGPPAVGTAGVYPLVFTASNGVLPDATQNFTLVINTAPVAGADTLGTRQGVTASAPASRFLLNDRDADGDALSLTGVSATSAQGGSVTLSGSTVTYAPPTSFAGGDSFTYTVSDGRGGFAMGTVNVTVTSSGAGTQNITGLTMPGGVPTLTAYGIVGRSYQLQYTDDMGAAWQSLGSPQTTNAQGRLVLTDPSPVLPPNRFYRVILAP